jgi:flagellar basal-body rod modification protein FlgD
MVTINPTTVATAVSTPGVPGQKSGGLGRDAFMNLLITQLQHQDPTAPQDDGAFIAQLAQFSTLEKLTTMDESLARIIQLLQPADDTVAAGPIVGAAAGTTTKGKV